MVLQRFPPGCPYGCAESRSAVTAALGKSKCPSMMERPGVRLVSEKTQESFLLGLGNCHGLPRGRESMLWPFERQMEKAIPRRTRRCGIRGDISGIGSSGKK